MDFIIDSTVIVALFSLLGTLCGTMYGIKKCNDITIYRINQLEKKVDEHNNLIERTYKIEKAIGVLDEREKVTEHRIDDLEHKGV